jgi:hypothetical protein
VLGHRADLRKEVREIGRVFALDRAPLRHLRGAGRAARELDHLVAQEALVGDLGDRVRLHPDGLALGDVQLDVESVVRRVVAVRDPRDVADVDAAEAHRRARFESLHVAEVGVVGDFPFEEALLFADEKNDDARHHEPGEHEDPHPHLLGTRHRT